MSAAPPNPFYTRNYGSTIDGGHAYCVIPAPGGKVSPEDAQDLIGWLGLIVRRLERDIQVADDVPADASHHGETEHPEGYDGPCGRDACLADAS